MRVPADSAWGPVLGYSRAVRAGSMVFVSGTTASLDEGYDGPDDAGHQAHTSLRRIAAALEQVGASLADVVRTRVYLISMRDFEAVAAAHGAAFGDVRPASTFVEVSALADPAALVEIEVDAVVGSGPDAD